MLSRQFDLSRLKDILERTISSLIASAEGGDPSAPDALFAVLYQELHRLAQRQLARNAPDMTLGTTTLLHEAYLDMSQRESSVFPDRARFMAYAARAMRTIIIDYVRSRQARKRGGGFEITTLDQEVSDPAAEKELPRLAEAVDGLARVDPLAAQVVDLKFFCGFSFAEIAAMRGVSERTVQRQWEKARLYLHDVIQDVDPA
jgi:RNA polymerase sigma factor (TIGR02999 family)